MVPVASEAEAEASRSHLAAPTRAFLERPPALLIGGRWGPAAAGRTRDTLDPATERPVATVAEGDAEDVDRAVLAARRALDDGPWPRMAPAERAKLLWLLAELLEEHAEELAQLETLDNGKPYAGALARDIPAAAEMFRYMAGWVTKIEGATFHSGPPGAFHAYTLRQPVGVVGLIVPWNLPLVMASWKLAPALAAGCTTILKPAEQTPLTALRLGELALEAGLPDGVLNVVTGDGERAGAALAAHPGVDKIAFTGSTAVGRLIVDAARGNLKKVSLELGGKSPNIILDDADLELAIPGAAMGIFANAGQLCTAGSRLLVQRGVYDEVLSGLTERASALRLGSGFDPRSEMGPLISQEQLDRVTGYLDEGRQAGARALTGGAPHGEHGFFVQPTVFADVADDMSIAREEIFGPVVAAMAFDDFDEVIVRANDTEFGLAAGIWTTDLSRAHRLAASIQAGSVWVNSYNAGGPEMPFGGFKQSGWGRERGKEGLEAYLETKSVVIKL